MNNRTNKTANSNAMTEIARRIENIQNHWSANDRNDRAKEGAARRDQFLAMLGIAQSSTTSAAA